MHPVESRAETLYDLPSQSQTPAFLRRQKREPQRSNEAAEKVRRVLLVAKELMESRGCWLLMPYLGRKQTAEMSFPFARLGNRTCEVQSSRSKGLNILGPVLSGESVGLGSEGRV